jgi:uncharacterized membrane protein
LEGWLQVLASVALASYPWLYSVGVVDELWSPWLIAVGAHAVWLFFSPTRSRLVVAASLASIAGLCFIQGLWIYRLVVDGSIQRDYWILASWIAAASTELFSAPANLWFYSPPPSHIQNYFDFIVPLLNRVFDLTSTPFGLMGFQAISMLSVSVITWGISIRNPVLWPFQLLLPVALVLHPSVFSTIQADYHTSGIGIGVLLLGTYLFFRKRDLPAFIVLLVGTLTKVSYWPCWLMLGLAKLVVRQWRWAIAYIFVGAAALLIYQKIQASTVTPNFSIFLGQMGSNPGEVVYNLVFHPELWWGLAHDPARWEFFGRLLLPLGISPFLAPLALVPVLPLALFSLLDPNGFRSMVTVQYASEYVGFLGAAALLGLLRVGTWWRFIGLCSMALGTYTSFDDPSLRMLWKVSYQSATANTAAYQRAVEFTVCTTYGAPVLITDVRWISYARGPIDTVWYDDGGGMRLTDDAWQRFETLVFPVDPANGESLVDFPVLHSPEHHSQYDMRQYASLFDRLPVSVTTPQGWRYRGGPRLKQCAERSGYQIDSAAVTIAAG